MKNLMLPTKLSIARSFIIGKEMIFPLITNFLSTTCVLSYRSTHVT